MSAHLSRTSLPAALRADCGGMATATMSSCSLSASTAAARLEARSEAHAAVPHCPTNESWRFGGLNTQWMRRAAQDPAAFNCRRVRSAGGQATNRQATGGQANITRLGSSHVATVVACAGASSGWPAPGSGPPRDAECTTRTRRSASPDPTASRNQSSPSTSSFTRSSSRDRSSSRRPLISTTAASAATAAEAPPANSPLAFSPDLPLTLPRIPPALDLGADSNHQTRFASHLLAHLALLSVLALIQPLTAIALTSPPASPSTKSAGSSSRRDGALLNNSLSLPTCPATWQEKGNRAPAAISGAAATQAGQSRPSHAGLAGGGKPSRLRRRRVGAKALSDAGLAVLAGPYGDDWLPGGSSAGNGGFYGNGNGNGNGNGAGWSQGGQVKVRGGKGAVSLAEAREMEFPAFRVEAPGQRIVAIGDVHGDWDQTLHALRIAGVLNSEDEGEPRWVGGNTVVVQVGDVLDRGADEIAILSLLRHLDAQAEGEGGAVMMLNGNHETMNVAEEFRYVSDGGMGESEDFHSFCLRECAGDWESAFGEWWRESLRVKEDRRIRRGGSWNGWNPIKDRRQVRERHELFEVGGPLAYELSRNAAALMVNDTLFAHGGILPHHVEYGLERMNRDLSRWMRGEPSDSGGGPAPMPFIATRGYNSVVWTRLYSQEYLGSSEDKYKICTVLSASLNAVGARRLVVGHTPQVGGANGECGGRVWRIDVGMSTGMLGAPPQVLEILGDVVQVLGSSSLDSLQGMGMRR